MAINSKKGFALLIAVIFVTIMLAFGVALSSLSYKQLVIASNATRSQYAFYAADAALECAMHEIQRPEDPSDPEGSDLFSFVNHNGETPLCGNSPSADVDFEELCYNNPGQGCTNQRITRVKWPIAYANPSVNPKTSNTERLCAYVVVFETSGQPAGQTFIYSEGYDTSCQGIESAVAESRIVTRGLFADF